MAYSVPTYEALCGLSYSGFVPDAVYTLHAVFLSGDACMPQIASSELGTGSYIRFRELGGLLARADKLRNDPAVETGAMLGGFVVTHSIGGSEYFSASVVGNRHSRTVPIQSGTYVPWMYGPPGSGTARHAEWWKRWLLAPLAISKLPEPLGYHAAAGDIVGAISLGKVSGHTAHVPVYAERPPAYALVNVPAHNRSLMAYRLSSLLS